MSNKQAFHTYYESVMANCHAVAEATFAYDSALGLQSKSHCYVEDYQCWYELIETRPERILLNFGINEYQVAQLHLSQGFYKQAFESLRSFFETNMFLVHLSTSEKLLNLWTKDNYDLKWALITNNVDGIFSPMHFTAFCPELTEYRDEYLETAISVYRECSEFVHGNYGKQKSLPDKLSFNQEIFVYWHDLCETMRLVITFVLFSRYQSLMSREWVSKHEPHIRECLGHISEVDYILKSK